MRKGYRPKVTKDRIKRKKTKEKEKEKKVGEAFIQLLRETEKEFQNEEIFP